MRRLGFVLSIVAGVQLVALPAFAQATKPTGGSSSPAPQDLIVKGQALFEDQHYEESVQSLSAALLRPSNTKEQKVEVYRLLAFDYITLGRTQVAENAVRGLLVQKPDYALPATESPRFRDFFASAQQKWEADGRPGVEVPTAKKIDVAQVPFRHQSPSQTDADKPVTMRGHVDGAASVHLYVRTGSTGDFLDFEANLGEKGDVRVEVPAALVKPPIVEYYLIAQNSNGDVIATRGDITNPIRFAVDESRGKGWVLPVAVGGGVLGAAAIVGVLALAGAFKGSNSGSGGGAGGKSTVSISIGETGIRFQ